MSLVASVPRQDASLTSSQATTALAEVKNLQQPSSCSSIIELKVWQRTLLEPSIPRRLASLEEKPLDLTKSNVQLQCTLKEDSNADTILYLAYGSNLSAETFLGKRGIRPLSQINVAVPSLVMTFDLAGLPYTEPCFANTAYRHSSSSSPHSASPSGKAPLIPSSTRNPEYHNPCWSKPMVGVVYEVTPSDFAHIIATEGGGSSYQDVLVDCHPLETGTSTVPFDPTTPFFKAHTLFSPIAHPEDPPPKNGGRVSRPDPEYAQPSARYLKLIRDGGAQHGLPSEYLTYLEALQPYTITTQRQRLGRFVFMMLWWPLIMAIFSVGKMFHDKKGRNPPWLATIMHAIFRGVWISYDGFFKNLFGDGERTQEQDPERNEEMERTGEKSGDDTMARAGV